MIVYIIWETVGYEFNRVLHSVYSLKEKANAICLQLIDSLPEWSKPTFDSFGQTSGTNFQVTSHKLEE